MKILRWIGRSVAAGVLALVVKWLWSNFDSLPVYYSAYPTEIVLGIFGLILLITGLCFLEIVLHRKIKLKEAFEISKPVKKLTPADFHITNYNKFYIQRESDKEIENLLKERKYVFITGIPMLGKTRMAYEASKKLEDFYLLKPKYEKIDFQKLKLPFFKRKIILFLDDLNKYIGKFHVDNLVRKLKRESKDFMVIATCRSGKEFDKVFAEKEMEELLTQCQKGKVESRILKEEEQSKLATAVDKRLERIASDGTPGSITIDLRYMKKRYDKLGDEKFILKCLKLLREGYIFLWKESLVKEVSKGIFDLNIERTRWDGSLKSLLRDGFISKSSERIFISHDVYLDDGFLDDYSPSQKDFENLREKLCELKDVENLNNLGLSFHRKKNFKQAQLCYSHAIKIKADYVDAHGNLANLLSEIKKYREAEGEYRKILEIDDNDSRTRSNLGVLLRKLERHEEAKREYREALRINPDSAEAHNNLGLLLHEFRRDYGEAEKEYRDALRLNPDFAEAHYNLGNLLVELKRYDEAEKEYREALRITPGYAKAHYNVGNLLYELKRYEEAEKEYKEALRINPDLAEPHHNLGILLSELKRYDEAKKEYRKALRINPDFAAAHVNLGLLLYDLKRYDEAEKEYKEASRINPDFAEAHNNLGLLLHEYRRHYEEAEKEYQEALRIKPDCAETHYNLGNLLLQLERYEEAEKEYREALRIDPDLGKAHCNLGFLLVGLNRKDAAKKEFQTARDLFRKQGREEDAKKAEGFLKEL